jgi:hypothetical protein
VVRHRIGTGPPGTVWAAPPIMTRRPAIMVTG